MTTLHPARTPRTRRRTATAVVALLLSLGTGLVPLAAMAAPDPVASAPSAGRATFGIKPSHATLKAPIDARARFDYTATPGAQQPDYVAVSNNADTPLHLSLYASDGFNTSTDGFDLLPASKKPVDVGSWITLKTNVLDVQPKQTVVVPFTVRVPLKVTPGDHIGGIVASLRTFGVDKKGDKVAIDQRVGTRVYLRIQGPLDPRLAISNVRTKYSGSWWNPFSSGKLTVSYTVTNPGNVRLGASQSVNVSGWYGAVHSAAPPAIDELLPDNAHSEQIVVSRVAPAFHEGVLITVAPVALPGDVDGRLTTVVATAHFWAIPWALMVVIVLAAVAVLVLLVRSRRRRKAAAAAAATPPGAKRKVVEAKP